MTAKAIVEMDVLLSPQTYCWLTVILSKNESQIPSSPQIVFV